MSGPTTPVASYLQKTTQEDGVPSVKRTYLRRRAAALALTQLSLCAPQDVLRSVLEVGGMRLILNCRRKGRFADRHTNFPSSSSLSFVFV